MRARHATRCILAALTLSLTLWGCGSKQKDKATKEQSAAGAANGTVSAVLSLGTKSKAKSGVQTKVKGKPGWQALKVGQSLTVGSTLRAAKGTRARVLLSDGTTLLLNQQTEVQMVAKRRLKVTKGELLAKVNPAVSATSPLFIETPSGTLKVTGTKLNLKVQGDETVVDVTRGAVEVSGSGTQVQVGAGERATVAQGKRPRVSLSRDLVATTSWAREISAPKRNVQQLQEGFGSLSARVPGQGGKPRSLRLADQQVRVTIRDGVARTEVEQVYYNKSSQTLEGTYRFPLPAGASISRLALYVGNKLMEGEIVERHRARRIFNKIVNDTIRPRDPALLEWVGGRTFRMKIFPIPPRASRRVILAYTQPLSASYGRYRYVYPMATSKGKATEVGRLALDVRLSGTRGLDKVEAPLYPVLKEKTERGVRLRYEATNFTPAASFVVNFQAKGAVPEMQLALYEKKRRIKAMAAGGAAALSARACAVSSGRPYGVSRSWSDPCGDRGGFFMTVLRPELPTSGKATRKDYLFLMDSSHSTGKHGWAVQASVLEAFLGEMDLNSGFNVMACDERCRTLGSSFRKPKTEARRDALEFVRKLKTGGSSNLQASFAQAAKLARAGDRPVHVVYLGDGRPTAGEMREPQLATLVVEQLSRVNASLSALQIGEDVAELFLKEATRRLGGAIHRIGAGDDMQERVFAIVASQYRPTLSNLEISYDGLKVHHVYPKDLPALTAGSEVVLVGRYDHAASGAIKLSGTVDGKPFERRYPVNLAANVNDQAANAFIPRLWAHQHLDALSMTSYAKNRPEIVRVSQAYTVLSRATALLVLENERMYKEFRVKRKRNRHYWKGDKVATRTAKDQTEQNKATSADEEAKGEKSAEKEGSPGLGKIGSLGSKGSGSGAGGSGSDLAGALSSRSAGLDNLRGASGPKAKASKSIRRRKARRRPMARPSKRAMRRSEDLDDSLASPFGDASPPPVAARPRPTAKPKPRTTASPLVSSDPAPEPTTTTPVPPMQGRRMSRRGPRRPGGHSINGLSGGGRSHRRRYRRVPVHQISIEPILNVVPKMTDLRQERRLRSRVRSQPLLRRWRKAYHRVLVRNGRYPLARAHAQKWADVDGSRPDALQALADMQAATGHGDEARRTYSSTVDVRPWSIRLHRGLARMYRNKGDLERSCAHMWSIMSLFPKQVDHHLKLAACLAKLPGQRDRALKILSDLAKAPEGRRSARRIGKALANLDAEAAKLNDRSRLERGALVIKATWDKPVDLDVALITPRGQRLSALGAGRRGGVADSRDGSTAEVLGLRWIGSGSYRVEIAHAQTGGGSAGPITGTLLIKARGKTKAVPFVLGASRQGKPVARVAMTTRYKRQLVPGYY